MTNNLIPQFLFSFYESLPRQGPGDDQITRSLLESITELPEKPDIIDMGCGTGAQTLILAERGNVTAVDIHQPFLDRLMKNAEEIGFSNWITPICCSIDALPPVTKQVDLIWSEGAIYIIGFEQGLKYWRKIVRPKGFVVVSELTRLSENPPAEVLEFWNTEYPAVQSIEGNCGIIKEAGYHCLKTSLLPSFAWTEFYAPQKKKIQSLRKGNLTSEESEIINAIEHEILIYEQYPDCYGYVFYVMQRPA